MTEQSHSFTVAFNVRIRIRVKKLSINQLLIVDVYDPTSIINLLGFHTAEV